MKHALVVVILAACGVGDDGGMAVKMDAAVDSSLAKVAPVTCPATPAATVMTVNGTDAYMPMSTTGVSAGGIVRFVMSTEHDVAPNTIGATDPGLVVDFGQTKCLQFNAAGSYGFFCTGHSFAGTITVQ